MAHGKELSLAIWIWLWSTPSMNYAIYPMVQTITSEDLRAHIFKISCECDTGLQCPRISKKPEEMELQQA